MKRAAPAAALVLLVLALYARAARFDFLTWDDYAYVAANEHVSAGLSVQGVQWAFTHTLHGNWHPLTLLSHMADVQLFGMSPGAHHLVNAGLHALNAVVLFLLLRSLTGALWPSILAAALFAVHPLNVETVAWIAERKSLLSLLFGLLAIGAYAQWTRTGSIARYFAFLGLFALSLMSKAMLVTLPLLLLAIDLWPLRRTPGLTEKLPAFAMSLLCAMVTFIAQRGEGAMGSEVALVDRILNAFVSTIWYVAKAVWPASLNSLYLHRPVSLALALASAALIAIVTFAVRKNPLLLSGWLWFLIALAPVLGIVQVGYQARADRYAYVPLIGLFIAAAWTLPRRVTAAAVIALCAVTTYQLPFWRNDETLYTRAVAIDPRNYVMLNNLSALRLEQQQAPEAAELAQRAIDANPKHAAAWANLGVALVLGGHYAQAVPVLNQALAFDARNQGVWRNLAAAYVQLGQYSYALYSARKALELDPNDPFARHWISAAAEALPRDIL